MDDDADAPIVIPTRDKALKRTARTKIRKAGLPGDGGGHRFAASRRGKKVTQTAAEPRTSSDLSTSDHGDAEPTSVVRRRTTRSEDGSTRPDSSYSEEQSIFDAYATQEDEEPAFSLPQPLEPFTVAVNPTPKHIIEELLPPVEPEPAPVLHQPQPQRLTVPQPFPGQGLPSRTPSPESFSYPPVSAHPAASSPFALTTSPPPTSKKEKEKDKKGLFKWGDKSGKKAQKEKEKEKDRTEKEPGFLFSLFSRKKQDSEYQSSITGGTSGREAAQALLGASKSKSHVSPASPGLAPGIGGNPYARYPLHVERAIYRLSHIKLANPRRPLYEQVLISNLMFWYLGIINKAQNPTVSQDGTNENTQSTDKQEAEKEEREREKEQREKAEKEHLVKERLEKERLEKESRERELEMKKRESGKRGPLIKSPPGTPTGGRRAEMPIKGPQYGMQHRVMEQEYGNYSTQQPPLSPTTPANGGSPGRRPPQPAAGQSTPVPNQPVHIGPVPPIRQMANPLFNPMEPVPSQPAPSYGPNNYRPQQRPGLPPGAMPPMDKQGWMSHTNSSTSSLHRTPSPQGRSHSPPNINQQFRKQNISQERLSDQNGNYRTPMRSLSVTASPGPPQPNGAGHSTSPGGYPKRPRTADSPASEEEDVPLAVWQQQRWR